MDCLFRVAGLRGRAAHAPGFRYFPAGGPDYCHCVCQCRVTGMWRRERLEMGSWRRNLRPWCFLLAGLLAAAVVAACTVPGFRLAQARPAAPVPGEVAGGAAGHYLVPAGIHKIKHVIVIMQENRSFDSYFGTYPGADGIPMRDGKPTVCVPNASRRVHPALPRHRRRQRRRPAQRGQRGRRRERRLDGRVHQAACAGPGRPAMSSATRRAYRAGTPDVMGYHTAAEIPNYWPYARDFALDDHMFEPVKSWSLPDHLYIVSAWSARCRTRSPMSCVNDIVGPYGVTSSTRPSPGADRRQDRRSTWPGPTSPGCCTPGTSAGPTTSRQAPSLTATTTRPRPALR